MQAFNWVLLGLLVWVYTYIRSRLAGLSCLSGLLLRPFAVLFPFSVFMSAKLPLFYGLSVFVWVVLRLPLFYWPVRRKAAAPACSYIYQHFPTFAGGSSGLRSCTPPPLYTVLLWFLYGNLNKIFPNIKELRYKTAILYAVFAAPAPCRVFILPLLLPCLVRPAACSCAYKKRGLPFAGFASASLLYIFCSQFCIDLLVCFFKVLPLRSIAKHSEQVYKRYTILLILGSH